MGQVAISDVLTNDLRHRLAMIHVIGGPNAIKEGYKAVVESGVPIEDKPSAPTFRVEVRDIKESHHTTWWVFLTRSDCPEKPFPTPAEGFISPYKSRDREKAEHEAAAWAAFLGAPWPPT